MSVMTLRYVSVGGRAPTEQTTHTLNGSKIGPAATLRILQYDGDPGYYLMHFNAAGEEIADTYHDTIEDAVAQAEWEFNIKPEEWRVWDN